VRVEFEYTEIFCMINVFLFVDSFRYGGAQNQVVSLANNLGKERFNVTICVDSGFRGDLYNEADKENVGIINLSFPGGKRYTILRFLHLAKLVYILRKEKVCIVHTHGYHFGVWGRIGAFLARVPVIVSSEHGKTLWKNRRQILFEKLANRFTDMRIAVSEDIRQLRIQNEDTPPNKIITLQNGVDTKRFGNVCKEAMRKKLGIIQFDYVIGTVANLFEAKAYHVLIDALSLVNSKGINFVSLCVGEGRLREELEQRALEKKLKDRILFLGSRSDIPELLGAMDVFVISSIREGLPVSMLEAMAAKVPVVATSVGGIPEVIRVGENGLLVPPNDSKKLAEKISFVLNEPEYGKRLADAAYQDILKKFSIQHVTKEIERIYLELFNSKSHSVS